jgi:hypothetical protein
MVTFGTSRAIVDRSRILSAHGWTPGECTMSTEAEDRKRERRAIVGLALASLPEEKEAEVRKKVFGAKKKDQPPKLNDSLVDLRDLTDRDLRESHRVLSLDLLAKAADRRPDVVEDSIDEVAGFARAVVDETDRAPYRKTSRDGAKAQAPDRAVADDRGPVAASERDEPIPEERSRGQAVDPRVPVVVSALRAVRSEGPEEHHWTRFARAARAPLDLTDEEINRPLCTDEQVVVMPGGLEAVRTAVWFWSDRPAKDFERWTDPRRWALDCGLFFKSVVPKKLPGPQGDEFCATFRETVNVGDGADLSTDLVFRRSIEGEVLYALEFNLPAGSPTKTAKIVVDAGQVTVREDPHAPDPTKRTSMLAEKFIRFKDPAYESWPTVACDLFWTEFAITMALGCAKDQ